MFNDSAGPLALLAQSEAREAGRSVGTVIALILAALLTWLIRKISKGDSLPDAGRHAAQGGDRKFDGPP
jgi:hypothetical protein